MDTATYLPMFLAEAREHISTSYGMLSAIDEHSCRFETGGSSLEVVATWIAMLGFDFVVEEPEELNARIQALAARLLRSCS